MNFAGVGQGDYGFTDQYAPPDTTGAVGATQYVQWANVNLAVFDKKTGAIVAGFPKPGNALWAGFGGGCETKFKLACPSRQASGSFGTNIAISTP